MTLRGWLRVPAFTAASLTLGVLGHVWAGGTLPGAGTLLLLIGTVGLIGTRLAHRERRLPELVAAVTLVQVAVHVALLDRGSLGGHSPAMTLAHAAAVVAVAWWLRRGEAAFWAGAARLLRRLTGTPVALPAVSPAARRRPPDDHRSGPFAGPGCAAWSVRGPPDGR